jgi:hypothetical protein
MRRSTLALTTVLALSAFGVGCESNNTPPRDQSPSAGGNGAFGEGVANPGEHSDQHFRDSVDANGVKTPIPQPAH